MPEETTGLGGRVVGRVDGFLDVSFRFEKGLAHFARHLESQFGLALGQQISYPSQDVAACWSRHATPGAKSIASCAYGVIDIFNSRLREVTDYIAVDGGVDILENGASRGFLPDAVNEVLVQYVGHGIPEVEKWFVGRKVPDVPCGDKQRFCAEKHPAARSGAVYWPPRKL